ncbi:MAG: tRNA preQ1(34) S-adenosylmethionine ribosyltransferase-isomerase QueA [Bdellovibrionota bacterium]
MKLSDLDFSFPEELIAQKPERPTRVMWVEQQTPVEITVAELLEKFDPKDVLVINETKVSKRRVFGKTSKDEFEILFIEKLEPQVWKVLFPASRLKKGEKVQLPNGIEMDLTQQGLPQIVKLSKDIEESYFTQFGEIPLPPYIQKSRNERHQQANDNSWYQTAWANQIGSQAAPTASLHFTQNDLKTLEKKGVAIEKILLHVGLGTFLPVKHEDLSKHEMHFEKLLVPQKAYQNILDRKKQGGKIWCIGTTVTRSLESVALGKVGKNSTGDYEGETDLFIKEDFNFQMTDVLLTNFHQPKTTLLALVSSFAGLENVKKCYQWAIDKKFKLFSYGDLTVWKR